MQVLILWANENSTNLGVRVLGRGAHALARKAWGNDISVDFQSFEPGPLGSQLSGKIVLQGMLSGNYAMRKAMSKYDAVIDTGAGDSFTDIYGPKRLVIMAYTRYIANLCKVPVILAPQTIGPFRTAWGRLVARATLKSAHTVMARDSASMKFALSLGQPADFLATDVAFALSRPAPSSSVSADIALNVSGLLWNSDTHGSMVKYRKMTRELIDMLLASGRSVTLVAHVLDNASSDNDLDAIKDLVLDFGDQVDVFIPKDLDEARSFISECSVVIGARMHACLNALSVGVPAIPLAYSRKFAPLLADIGWPYTIDLRSDTQIGEKVLAMLENDQLKLEATKVRAEAEGRLLAAAKHLSRAIRIEAGS